ncbi:MAG: radical SAM protein [Promethearchaeota archaeon]
MSDEGELLKIIKSKNADWSHFSRFLELQKEKLEPFFNFAQEITRKNFGNVLKIYVPNVRFHAISVTGSECALSCTHCNKKYLEGMKSITSDTDLYSYLLELYKNGGIGALISGGCDLDGSVPLIKFLDAVKKIKNETNLIINTHTGLLQEDTAKKLAEVGVDIVSFDINMDEDIIHNIYHLEKNVEDYKRAVKILKKYDLNIVPHICIGLYYGKLHKELDSIKFIKESGMNPSLIVLIALIPPKNSTEKFERPDPLDIAKVIATIRFIFPNTEISLGCMRPRGDIKVEVEKRAIKAGITRIEIPSPHTLNWLKSFNPDISFQYYSACCAIPAEFENLAKSIDSDIKRYLNI